MKRVALAVSLVVGLGCEEGARFGSWNVARAPHPPWTTPAAASASTSEDAFPATRPGLTPSLPFEDVYKRQAPHPAPTRKPITAKPAGTSGFGGRD